jgi:hypothetical protein
VTRRVGILQDASRPRTPAVDEFVSLLRTFDGDAGSLPEFTRWGAGEASRTRGAAPSM